MSSSIGRGRDALFAGGPGDHQAEGHLAVVGVEGDEHDVAAIGLDQTGHVGQRRSNLGLLEHANPRVSFVVTPRSSGGAAPGGAPRSIVPARPAEKACRTPPGPRSLALGEVGTVSKRGA